MRTSAHARVVGLGDEHTCRMVTAVSTLELTASILLLSLNRLRASFFFLIAFEA